MRAYNTNEKKDFLSCKNSPQAITFKMKKSSGLANHPISNDPTRDKRNGRVVEFVQTLKEAANEDADAKPFLVEFFNVFGITCRRVASFE